MIEHPPAVIVSAVNQIAPGIWPLFLRAANAALSAGDEVTSWFRTPSKNHLVGGHPESQHLVGLAFDVATLDPIRLAASLRAVGFVAVEGSRHVHAQTFRAGALGPSGIFDSLGLRRF